MVVMRVRGHVRVVVLCAVAVIRHLLDAQGALVLYGVRGIETVGGFCDDKRDHKQSRLTSRSTGGKL